MSLTLNPWLESTLAKARRLMEDSDRRCQADRMFLELVRRTHHIASVNALDTEVRPTLERFEHEGAVSLILEWSDRSSGWFVKVSVMRDPGQKPIAHVEMFGNPQNTSVAAPTDEQIRQALWEYFESWRGRGAPRTMASRIL